jgi:hypothetical protein
MSCVWSIFGIIGANRFCVKVAVGLAFVEAAGDDLFGAGVFTSRKASDDLNFQVVAEPGMAGVWQDALRRCLQYLPNPGGILMGE